MFSRAVLFFDLPAAVSSAVVLPVWDAGTSARRCAFAAVSVADVDVVAVVVVVDAADVVVVSEPSQLAACVAAAAVRG